MRKYPLWLVFILISTLLSGCGAKPGSTGIRTGINPAHPSLVTRQQLNAVLSSGSGGKAVVDDRIVSGVVPHHLVAAGPIADFFSRLSPQKPDLVILVGPNHPNKGSKIITGSYDWQTPEGLVITDQRAVNALVDQGLAVKNEDVLGKEHSVGALMPMVRHYLPQARVVPVILQHNVSLEEIDALIKGLEPNIDDRTVLISSVDFSHYLTRQEAEAMDKETLRYMRDYDFNNLFRLGNDHLDSPPALAAAFRLAQGQGIKEFTVLQNTNSGVIMRNDMMETTSYFTIVFTRQ